ncbi:uncharacterized protein N7469_011209 [Penicillium citrinum]|uniref:Uncharacterized protein n=2 Tax=Penicillium TaxID=5073 RepID=A0A9W9NER4_PENCI|nr:uncharacterized protein N7469_011209 [Penicillium citrinum]KAJ5217584.1 hypothetical protein N7469_011209 [Penicillium citrinum]KAJ5583925.1 hypothetical protein N7450_006589 [Penicillium hetheringtonii]
MEDARKLKGPFLSGFSMESSLSRLNKFDSVSLVATFWVIEFPFVLGCLHRQILVRVQDHRPERLRSAHLPVRSCFSQRLSSKVAALDPGQQTYGDTASQTKMPVRRHP